ncbi:MAG: phospho-2-dehydro-3-deoxyheptonate aldolase, partial [Treponemataceae bacterium]|nr:phospho-2-dehydro-3-deoxyheptonate aldolase [Treponemataceae bacterium]
APNHLTDGAADQSFRQRLGEGTAPNMASFMFSTPNEPGALYECLGIFQQAHLNLSRLESRPIAGKPWRYWFYADAVLDESVADKESYVRTVLDALRAKTEDVRLLGVYNGS